MGGVRATIGTITFCVGLALIVVAIFGGGIEVKEFKVPTLAVLPRVMSFVAGASLSALCILYPSLFGNDLPKNAESIIKTQPKRTGGSAIAKGLIQIVEVKRILQQVNLYQGAMDNEMTEYYFQAVAKFQMTHNLSPDGAVGPETLSKLRDAWPAFFNMKQAVKDSPPATQEKVASSP